MKKVLILGAGLMQKPAIVAAKRLGFRAVVVDADSDAVCVPLADSFFPVDLKDRDALVALARRLSADDGGLCGVFTAGTDFSASVAFVAEKLSLPSHSFASCVSASDKVQMRGCFQKAGVPSPEFTEVRSDEIARFENEADAGNVVFPKVVKPCDNMGGRGCRLARNGTELVSALKAAVANSRTGRAVLEDYMEGAEFSIDSVVYNGTLTITGFADRHIFYPPYFIEMGHTLPSSVPPYIRNELIATFALGIQALGLTCGVAKADIKYTKNGPMIGEIAARLSGGYMSGWTFPYSSGMNLTEEALKIAVGREPDCLIARRVPVPWQPHGSVKDMAQPFDIYEVKSSAVSAERAWISIPGTVSRVYGLERAERVCGVRDVLPRVRPGDAVSFPRNNVEKCGNIISCMNTAEQAAESARTAVGAITIRLEPNNAMTDSFLSGVCCDDESGFPPSAFAVPSSCCGNSGGFSECPVPENEPAASRIPESLLPFADSAADWNHCTLRRTLEKFDELCPAHKKLPGEKFWNAVVRGGIQGALYVADSVQ